MVARPAGSGQRQRLVEAMTIVAARHGYSGASVARVVRQAGVSRATFYEQFDDRDDCFLAAFRAAAAGAWEELRSGADGSDEAGRLRHVLARLLGAAEESPAASRLILIEAMGAGEAVRNEHEQLIAEVEQAFEQYLGEAAAAGAPIEIPPLVLIGGIVNLVAMRIFRHEVGASGEMLDDLLVWLRTYEMPPTHRRLSGEDWAELGRAWLELEAASPPPVEPKAARLPRGRGALPSGQVASEHRERIVAATAECVRAKGYAATTVADVVAGAGVARSAFYDQFRSKEDAFLAAQSQGLEKSAAIVASRFFIEAAWPDRIWSLAEALAGYVDAHRDLAYAGVVESYAVGPAAIRRAFESRMAFTLFLEDGYRARPEAEALPRICSEAIAGAAEDLIRRHLVRQDPPNPHELVPQCVYMALAPFIGADAAFSFVNERCRTGPRSARLSPG